MEEECPAQPCVLAVIERAELRAAIVECLSAYGSVQFAGSLDEALQSLAHLPVSVVLCDRETPGLDWRHALSRLAAAPYRACVILLAPVVGQQLWEEATACGGYDVLPSSASDALLRTVQAAYSHWRCQRALDAEQRPNKDAEQRPNKPATK